MLIMSQDVYPPPPADQGPAPDVGEQSAEASSPSTPSSATANIFAVVALVLGVVAILSAFVPFIGMIIALPSGLAAVVLGFVARGRARELGGRGLAITGVITGAIGIIVSLLWAVVAGLFFAGVESELGAIGDVVEEMAPVDPGDLTGEVAAATLWTEPLEGEFWFSGMRMELTEAELATDDFGVTHLFVHGLVENLTDDTLNSFEVNAFWLDVDGTQIAASWESMLDPVPSRGTNRGTLAFPVSEDFALTGAVLYAGSPAQQQAILPLDGVGELVSGAPYEPDISGSLTAGDTTVVITDAQVRTFGQWGNQLDSGRLYLELTVDVTYDGDHPGGQAIGPDEFRLTAPDGRSISPTEYPILALDAGSTERGERLTFEIDDPPTGDYALTYIEWGTDLEASHEFTL